MHLLRALPWWTVDRGPGRLRNLVYAPKGTEQRSDSESPYLSVLQVVRFQFIVYLRLRVHGIPAPQVQDLSSTHLPHFWGAKKDVIVSKMLLASSRIPEINHLEDKTVARYVPLIPFSWKAQGRKCCPWFSLLDRLKHYSNPETNRSVAYVSLRRN